MSARASEKNPATPKAYRLWGMVTRYGHLMLGTLHRERKGCIESMLRTAGDIEYAAKWREHGYRCVRFVVTPGKVYP